MNPRSVSPVSEKPIHDWLKRIQVAFLPGTDAENADDIVKGILKQFQLLGHAVKDTPTPDTDVILTTARYGEPISWREAPLFTARKKYQIRQNPTIYTVVKVRTAEFREVMSCFEKALKKTPPDPADYDFPGLSADGYRILHEQGTRGGPILAVERLVQAWAKSVHVLLVVGDDRPTVAYHFDLVGAYPSTTEQNLEEFYRDIALRIVTTLSTREITQHVVAGDPISREEWAALDTPKAMSLAGQELGERGFFTDMVRISDLVAVPAVTDGISSQYSEGCFSTWEPRINGLIATITGSARPVYKGSITEDDLAILIGVREDGLGALTHHVEGKQNYSPSSESVEMLEIDSRLPKITLGPSWNISAPVPIIRSKLHGHRNVTAFDPTRVEFVPLDPAYYHYLVSCATEAQARGIADAFARSKALTDPADPRPIAFTVLPGHGTMLVEKWIPGKRPFQLLWESMDAGILEISSRIPQGPVTYLPGSDGRMRLEQEVNPLQADTFS